MQATIVPSSRVDVKAPPKKGEGGVVEKVQVWNQINLRTTGIQQITIWLAPNMIDFTKPVAVTHNGKQLGQRMVQPSIATMLEDFLHTWDRQRLYLAKLSLKL